MTGDTEPKEELGPFLTVRAHGRIDLGTCEQFRSEIAGYILAGARRITIDLTDVDYIDSAGLGALVGNVELAHRYGATLRVTGTSLRTQRVFDITGLTDVFKAESTAVQGRT